MPRVLLEPQHQARVHRSRPGRHHQAVQRREPHGGVHRPAGKHGGERRARAQVAGDDPQPVRRVRRHAEQFRHPPRGVGVGQAVEPVPAQRPAGPPLGGQRERRRRVRDGRVERGVEAGHRGRAGQHGGHRVERGERLGLVQRREVGERLEPPPHLGVDEHRRGVQRPAVHDPVPDRVHRAERLDRRLDRRRCRRRRRAARAGRRRPSPRRHGAEDAQLEAARPGVDDEHPGCRVASMGYARHVQSLISGASSPNSLVYARHAIRLSAISCRTCPAVLPARAPGRSRPSPGGTGPGR